MPLLTSDPDISLLIWKLLAAVWIAALILLEFSWPKETASPNAPVQLNDRVQRWGRNLGLAALNFLQSPLLVAPVSFWFAAHALDWRPNILPDSNWGQVGAIIFEVLLLDLWVYFWHRANHEIPFLWRFHEVHHRDSVLDASSALRFHFGEVILSTCVRGLFIFFLGIDIVSVVIFEGLILAASLFHHSNITIPEKLEKYVSRILVTPSIHWVHHHALRQDTDSNYASILSLWDPIFGTRSKTQRFSGMPIGVEGRKELTLLQLLLRPFRSN